MSTYRRQQLRFIVADILSAEVVWLLFLLFRWIVYEGKVLSVEGVLIPAFDFHRPLLLYPLGYITQMLRDKIDFVWLSLVFVVKLLLTFYAVAVRDNDQYI